MFCKRVLKVRSTTPNYMVYGELGRIPFEITIEIKMASFLRNMIYGNKISSCMYKLLFSLKQNGVHTFKWLNFIKSILNDTGMGYVFVNQDDSDYKLLLKQILQDQYIQNGTMTCSYHLKENICFEKYLIKIPYNLRIWITKLRTSNLKILIETGR